MTNDILPRVFRLKRKFDEDPFEKLTISIKKLKKIGDDDSCVIRDVLQFTKSSTEPISSHFHNATYHDLDVVELSPEHEIQISDFDPECLPFQDEPVLDELYTTPPSSPSSRDPSLITCNGQPMKRAKRVKRSKFDDLTVGRIRPIEVSDYVYDFYVPESYALFKEDLPDKLVCKIDVGSMLEGVVSLNACSDPENDVNNTLHFGSVESYYRNQFDIDRMLESHSTLNNENFVILNDEQRDDLTDGLPIDITHYQFNNPVDSDEDSNDENNWRNDYPDEEPYLDQPGFDFSLRDEDTYSNPDPEDQNNILDAQAHCYRGENILASKFEGFDLEEMSDSE